MDKIRNQQLHDQFGPQQVMNSCPNGELLTVDPSTGEIDGLRCRRNDCLYCVRGKVARMKRAIRFTRPTALLTFTALSADHKVNQLRINRLAKYLRRDHLDIAWVWASELNPRGTGVHAHAWSRGDVPAARTLNAKAALVGVGHCDVEPVTHGRDLSYIAKMAAWNEESLRAYRALNGSELVHGRAFWRDPISGKGLRMPDAASRQRRIEFGITCS